jgi:hypothetical protein
MNLEPHKISKYKNNLSVTNLLFCIALISLGYTDPVPSIKSMIGIIFATLCPILWNQWLYGEMFQKNDGKPFMICQSFLWIGFSIAFATSVVLVLGVLLGTL